MQTSAHAGMVAPMSDVQAACAQCHPSDLQARADVYTVSLGMPAASIGEPAAAASPAPWRTPPNRWTAAEAAAPAAPANGSE